MKTLASTLQKIDGGVELLELNKENGDFRALLRGKG